MLNPSLSEGIFLHIQHKLLLVQHVVISSHPVTCHLGEQTDPRLLMTSFQAAAESDKVPAEPPSLQTKPSLALPPSPAGFFDSPFPPQ